MKQAILAGLAIVAASLSGCGKNETSESGVQASQTAQEAGDRIAQKAVIDAALKKLVDNGEAAGAEALVYRHGKEVYFGAAGMADIAAGRPMTRDAIVRIFSMTKPVAGVALMTQYEKGAFKLDDPVSDYLPEFATVKVFGGVDAKGNMILVDPKRPIAIRDLTRHTAGFVGGDEGPVRDFFVKADPFNPSNTLEDAVRKFAAVPLLYQPGERWLYSNAVDVQARLVEVFSGEPFDKYVEETILKPLGMKDTGYYIDEAKRDRLAVIYTADDDGKLIPASDPGIDFNLSPQKLTPGTFGLTATIDDYMRFARMLLNKGELEGVRILKPETVALMSTNQLPSSVTDRSWLPGKGQVGFGIDFAVRVAPPADDKENYGEVGEFFWDGYASTLFWVDPKDDLAAVFFMQRIPFYGAAHKLIRDAVYGEMERSAEAGPAQ